jgi:hypothetical protein
MFPPDKNGNFGSVHKFETGKGFKVWITVVVVQPEDIYTVP